MCVGLTTLLIEGRLDTTVNVPHRHKLTYLSGFLTFLTEQIPGYSDVLFSV